MSNDLYNLWERYTYHKENEEESQQLIQQWLNDNPNLAQSALLYTDENNCTPLHCLLKTPLPSKDLVAEFLHLAPDTAQIKTNDLFLPLHLACLFGSSPDIIQLLLNAYPKGIQERENGGSLPLHLASLYGNSPNVVRMLLEAYPQAVQEQDVSKRLPIHYACESKADPEIVQMLLKAYAKGLEVQDCNNGLPIHYACKFEAPLEVLQILVDTFPAGLEVKDTSHRLPLHYACESAAPTNVIDMLLTTYPKSLQIQDKNGSLPIHLATVANASHIVPMLLDAYPKGAEVTDKVGSLPLHYACKNKDSSDIVSMLLEIYPEGLQIQDINGRLPIHFATTCSPQVVRMNLMYPEGVDTVDKLHRTPLHYACESLFDKEGVVSMLLDISTKSLQVQDQDGWLPLHLACRCAASSPNVIKLLIDNYQQGLEVQDHFGLLPLHLTCLYGNSTVILQMLLDEYPEGIHVPDKEVGGFPLHCACNRGASLEMLQILVEKSSPKILQVTNRFGRTPAQELKCSGAAERKDTNGMLYLHRACSSVSFPHDILNLLLDAYPEGTSKTDNNGMLPFHYASANASISDDIIQKLLPNKHGSIISHRSNNVFLTVMEDINTTDAVHDDDDDITSKVELAYYFLRKASALEEICDADIFFSSLKHQISMIDMTDSFISSLKEALMDMQGREIDWTSWDGNMLKATVKILLKMLASQCNARSLMKESIQQQNEIYFMVSGSVRSELQDFTKLSFQENVIEDHHCASKAKSLIKRWLFTTKDRNGIHVLNQTKYTLHVSVQYSIPLNCLYSSIEYAQTTEPSNSVHVVTNVMATARSTVDPGTTETYPLNVDCEGALVTIRQNINPSIGWAEKCFVKKGSAFKITGEPEIIFTA